MAGRKYDDNREIFWISYSDLITGLLLVFMVMIAAMMAHYRTRQEKIIKEVDQLVLVRQDLALRLKLAADTTNAGLGVGPEAPGALRYDALRQQVQVQEGAWFDQGKSELKPDARLAMDAFIPALYDAMLGKQAEGAVDPLDYLAAIEIQGHTDPVWVGELWTWENYLANTVLSQERAAAVTVYAGEVLARSGREWRPFFAYVQTAGRSWTEAWCGGKPMSPIDFRKADPCPERSVEDDGSSRRVTFGIRLDDQKVVQSIGERAREGM